MKDQFKQVQSITGTRYFLATGEEMEERFELSWKGRMIYDLLKEQQPERFTEMQRDKTLLPFLQKITHQWFLNIKEHAQNQVARDVAEELEWQNLVEAAGLLA